MNFIYQNTTKLSFEDFISLKVSFSSSFYLKSCLMRCTITVGGYTYILVESHTMTIPESPIFILRSLDIENSELVFIDRGQCAVFHKGNVYSMDLVGYRDIYDEGGVDALDVYFGLKELF